MKTPKSWIKFRDGKKGGVYKYVDRSSCHLWLDENFPGWSFEAIAFESFGEYVYCTGKLTVFDQHATLNGQEYSGTFVPRIIQCRGSKEAIRDSRTKELVPHDYYKSAETDALKRCAFTLGFAMDVYTGDDYDVINISEQDATFFLNHIKDLYVWLIQQNDTSLEKLNKLRTIMTSFVAGNLPIEKLSKTLNIKE